MPYCKLVLGFQQATNEGFIIPSAPGWLPVDFLVARSTDFYSPVHSAAIIWLCLLTVKAEIGKRLYRHEDVSVSWVGSGAF